MSISPFSNFSAATTEMVAISAPPTGTPHDLYFYRSLRVIDLTKLMLMMTKLRMMYVTLRQTEYDYDTKYYNLR